MQPEWEKSGKFIRFYLAFTKIITDFSGFFYFLNCGILLEKKEFKKNKNLIFNKK
jgi:hypothetical protein